MRGNTPPCAGDVPRQAAAASARPGGVFRPNSSVATPPTRSRIRWAATVAIDVPRLVAVAVIHEGTVNHMRRVASDRRVAKTAGRITGPLGDAFPVHGAQPIADESLGTTRANFTTMVADRRFSPFFHGITRRDRSKLLSLPARPTAGSGAHVFVPRAMIASPHLVRTTAQPSDRRLASTRGRQRRSALRRSRPPRPGPWR